MKAYKFLEQCQVREPNRGVRTRAANALANPKLSILLAKARMSDIRTDQYHVLTVAELCEIPEHLLSSSRLIGPRTLSYIKDVLTAYNLKLGNNAILDKNMVERIIHLYCQWQKAVPGNLKDDRMEAVDYVVSNYNMNENNSI